MKRQRRPPRPRPTRPHDAPPARWRPDRALAGTVLAVLTVLALVGDDRHVGLVADGRQMIRTAVAIAETGEIGQARGRDFTIERPDGDAVSRFGMAMSLLQVPAAWMASPVEAARGPGSSQALFLVVPWLALGVAAAASGAVARRLGGSHAVVASAVLLASIASPLGSYALMEFSEPVQSAALAVALFAALAAAQSRAGRPRLEYAAGLAAGLAVLAKSNLIVATPAALLPLADPASPARSRRALIRAGVGAAGPMAVWAAFELVRFGHFFGGYPDDRFSHPWFDGLWRLLVGPNRGLLWFWPALALFAWYGHGTWRQPLATPASRAWAGAGLVLASQLAVAAGYWGWHGMEGWGPRLILAPLPLLAPFAALAAGAGGRTAWPAVVVIVCTAINLPPLLQHPTPVATYVSNVAWAEVPDEERGRYPFYATAQSPSGRLTVVPFAMLEREPAASPWLVYWWFWHGTALEGDRLSDWLMRPPWAAARPDLVPEVRWPPSVAREVAPPRRTGFLGRSLTQTGGPYATVYLDALLDQVVRANQLGQLDRALRLSERRLRLGHDGEAAAWRLESLRRTGRAFEADALLRTLPERVRAHPLVNVALALFDRDGGEEARARALLRSVAASFPGTPLQRALTSPLSQWPATLDAMVQVPRRDAAVARPR